MTYVSRLGAVLSAMMLVVSTAAFAAYPERPVTWIVPYAAGGSGDIVCRILSNHLNQKLNIRIVVENKPGGGAAIGQELAARARADGYTLLYDAFAMAINPSLLKDPKVDPEKDFATITQLTNMWSILVVPASSPYPTFAEFIEDARKNPGKLNFGASGASAGFLASELLKTAAKIDLVTILYKGGGPATQATVTGEVQVYFATAGSGMPFIKSGQLRALAVAAPKRINALPDVPTLIELGYPDFAVSEWTGMFAPKETPQDVIQYWNRELAAVMQEPAIQQQIGEKLGIEIVTGTPQQFGDFVKSESIRWGKLIKERNIKPE